jgi:hypothetical protein
VKQFGVTTFQRTQAAIITLMTPEPTGGVYKLNGVVEFLRRYGYPDKNGRDDRINFGGIHKVGLLHPSTKLKMELIGFDPSSRKITRSDGRIALIDQA